jgi:periplasmic copper chaperone A
MQFFLLALIVGAGWLAISAPAGAAGAGGALQASPQVHSRLLRMASGPTSYTLGPLVIEAPWARATPGGAQVAAGYVKVTNKGSEPDRLTGGTLPVAAAVEVHEMSMSAGVMKMRRLEQGLEIKPGQTVELKPGGYHIMFMGLREGLKEGQPVKGTLVFEKAGTIEIEYRVAPIGAQSGGQSGSQSGGQSGGKAGGHKHH